ncbi:MAG: elongation factor G [Candidatus Coatesbacteria bacterium]|nr:MAG: elongation factor G [Candidatus Coatesbacteria bacterium]
MKDYDIAKIRNIVLCGHGDSGKTSLAEAILFNSGKTTRLGKVEDGTTVMDWEPEEVERGISISSSFSFFESGDTRVNLIDTPGYADFVMDAKSPLMVSEGAIIVLCGVAGVEVQAQRVWDFCERYGTRRMLFVNKMERERADLEQVVNSVRKFLTDKIVVLDLPIGHEAGFEGVIDLVEMKAFLYDGDGSGKSKKVDIPEEYADQATKYREKMVEAIVSTDDALLERYLDEANISNIELMEALSRAVKDGALVPVLCGSAKQNIGVDVLSRMAIALLPSPADSPPVIAKDASSGKDVEVKIDLQAPLSAFVFKTIADPYAGKLSVMKVYSGALSSDSTVLNVNQGRKERIGQLIYLEGKGHTICPLAKAGDIVAVAKLKETTTGDTLCDESRKIIFAPIEYPEPMISFAIEPKSKGDEDKISSAVSRLMEEDPTMKSRRDPDTKELVISGSGQLHVEVIVSKMKRKFGVEVNLKAPKIPYRETIRKKVKAQGKYKKQTGGRGQYGDCWLELEPLPRGAGFEFVDRIVGGVIPRQYIPAVEKGVIGAMQKGVLAGYPVVDLRVTVYDGSFHTVDSSEMAFKIAGSLAFKKAAAEANPVLLEPIVELEVVVPEDSMGDVIGDLSSRRGKVIGTETIAGRQVIKAIAPLAELSKYAPDLRSITGGRGSYTMQFSRYEQVPSTISEKIIAKSQQAEE